MKIKSMAASYSWDGSPILNIELEKREKSAVDELLSEAGPNISKYELTVAKPKKKRSRDANAYAWVLMGQIAQKTRSKTKLDVYRSYIREMGIFEPIPVREDAIRRWTRVWESKGDGFLCEDMGPCRNTPGYRLYRCYYGSSTYTPEEMGHLIDLIVADCKDLGIETMTPAEIAQLMNTWRENDEI